MAFLNAQREKLAAMGEMANVAAQAGQAMQAVAERMQSIQALESGKVQVLKEDPEVEMWKKKIAALSAGGPARIGDKPPPPALRSSIHRDNGSNRDNENIRGSSNRGSDNRGSDNRGSPSRDPKPSGSRLTRIPKNKLTELGTNTPVSSSGNEGGEIRRKKVSNIPGISRSTSRKEKPRSPRAPPRAPDHPLVASVEKKIERMNRTPLAGVDPEVEMWKKKIAELTKVNPTAKYSSPLSTNNVFSPTNPKGSAMDAIRMRKKEASGARR